MRTLEANPSLVTIGEPGNYVLGPGVHFLTTSVPVRLIGTPGAVMRALIAEKDLTLDDVDFDIVSGRGFFFGGQRLEVNGGRWRLAEGTDGLEIKRGGRGEMRRVVVEGGARQAAVRSGTLVVRECRFEGARSACVAAIGSGARIEVHDSRAQRSKLAFCAIEDATMLVRGARIEASTENGICATDGGRGEIERLVLEGSDDAGIIVGERSSLRLSDADVSGCKRFGLQAAGEVHLERVRFSNNDVGLGLYGRSAQHRLIDVVAEDNKEGGLFAYWGTSIWAVRCVGRRNRDAGLELTGESRARSFDGTFQQGLTYGIQARDGSQALVEGGTISRNTDGAVDAASGHALLLGTNVTGELKNAHTGDSAAWRAFIADPHRYDGTLSPDDRLRLAPWAVGRCLAGDFAAPSTACRLGGPDVGALGRSVARAAAGNDDGLWSAVKYYIENNEQAPADEAVTELWLTAAEQGLERGDLEALENRPLTPPQQTRAMEVVLEAFRHTSTEIVGEARSLWRRLVPAAPESIAPGVAREIGAEWMPDPSVHDDLRGILRLVRPFAKEDDPRAAECLRGEGPEIAALTAGSFDPASAWTRLHTFATSDDPVTRWQRRQLEYRMRMRLDRQPLAQLLAIRKHAPLLLLRAMAERELHQDEINARERYDVRSEPGPALSLLRKVDPDGDAIAALCRAWLRKRDLLEMKERVPAREFEVNSGAALKTVADEVDRRVKDLESRYPALARHGDDVVASMIDFNPVWTAYRIATATATDLTRTAMEERERWPLLYRRGPIWAWLSTSNVETGPLQAAARAFLAGIGMPIGETVQP